MEHGIIMATDMTSPSLVSYKLPIAAGLPLTRNQNQHHSVSASHYSKRAALLEIYNQGSDEDWTSLSFWYAII